MFLNLHNRKEIFFLQFFWLFQFLHRHFSQLTNKNQKPLHHCAFLIIFFCVFVHFHSRIFPEKANKRRRMYRTLNYYVCVFWILCVFTSSKIIKLLQSYQQVSLYVQQFFDLNEHSAALPFSLINIVWWMVFVSFPINLLFSKHFSWSFRKRDFKANHKWIFVDKER